MNIKEFRYIYNIYQANYYIKNKIELIEVGTAPNGRVFYKFKDSYKLQQTFKSWCNLQNNKKNN